MSSGKLLLLAVGLASCSAGAKTRAVALNEIPLYTFTISAEAGKPLVVTWKDGREAMVVKNETPTITIPFPMSVTDNSCNTVMPKGCVLSLPFKSTRIDLRWTKHPNAERVGKPVRWVSRYNGGASYYEVLSRIFIFDSVTRAYAPEFALDAPATAKCDRVDWIDFDSDGAAQISSWMNQDMNVNAETGQNENALTTNFTRTKLKKIDATRFEITSIGRRQDGKNSGFSLRIVTSEFLMWGMPASQGICPIALSLDLSILNRPEFAGIFSFTPPKDAVFEPLSYALGGLLPNMLNDLIMGLVESPQAAKERELD